MASIQTVLQREASALLKNKMKVIDILNYDRDTEIWIWRASMLGKEDKSIIIKVWPKERYESTPREFEFYEILKDFQGIWLPRIYACGATDTFWLLILESLTQLMVLSTGWRSWFCGESGFCRMSLQIDRMDRKSKQNVCTALLTIIQQMHCSGVIWNGHAMVCP